MELITISVQHISIIIGLTFVNGNGIAICFWLYISGIAIVEPTLAIDNKKKFLEKYNFYYVLIEKEGKFRAVK